jgi:hypothetical protein
MKAIAKQLLVVNLETSNHGTHFSNKHVSKNKLN